VPGSTGRLHFGQFIFFLPWPLLAILKTIKITDGARCPEDGTAG